jgi:hypothetical protein
MHSSLSRFVFSAFFLVLSIWACNGSIDERAVAAGGTPAPDGSDGYCCPARTGGCALSGGYRESGDCPKDFDICDNMCEQEIVKDSHGCDRLTYKAPPVTTTFAGTGSCSHPVFNGQDRPDSGSTDAAADGNDAHSDAASESASDAGADGDS